MAGLCLFALGGALLASLPGTQFTLSWTHSIEKTEWREAWTVEAGRLRPTEARIRAIETIRTEPARTTAALLRFSQRTERTLVGWPSPDWGAPLHDPCPIAWLMRPDLFTLKPCRIEIETGSDLTRGHTAVEFRVEPAAARHHWAVKADGQGVFDLIATVGFYSVLGYLLMTYDTPLDADIVAEPERDPL